MTALNIDNYKDDQRNAMVWEEGAEIKQKPAKSDLVQIHAPSRSSNLLDLARTISYRAHSRRRFSRSSTII